VSFGARAGDVDVDCLKGFFILYSPTEFNYAYRLHFTTSLQVDLNLNAL